jgi:hypothetical protein
MIAGCRSTGRLTKKSRIPSWSQRSLESLVHNICTTKRASRCNSVPLGATCQTGLDRPVLTNVLVSGLVVTRLYRLPTRPDPLSRNRRCLRAYFWVARSGFAHHLHNNAHRGRDSHQKQSRHPSEELLNPKLPLSVNGYRDVRYIGTSEERLDALKGTARPDSPMRRVEFHSPALRPAVLTRPAP